MMLRVLVILLLIPPCLGFTDDNVKVANGRTIAGQICAACHGLDGNGLLGVNPTLAAQHSGYLYKQLREFKNGARENAIMAAMVANLSDLDMRNLAAFYSQLAPIVKGAEDINLAQQGEAIYRGGIMKKGTPACSSCHLANGAGIPENYPRLAGQNKEYIVNQLRAFKNEIRSNDPNGMMRMIAKTLDENEIDALAEFISGLN